MVSPTGQFIVPATMPGALLVNFITKNLEDAKQKNNEYQRYDIYIMDCINQIHSVIDQFNLILVTNI